MPRASLLLATTALAALPTTARADETLPQHGEVIAGSATVATTATTLTVTQQTPRAVIQWDGFSVGAGNTVNFVQPDIGAAVLNRVTGAAPSTLAGAVYANGQVYLVNPNGIAITPTGTVAASGGFVASSLDLAPADFLAGRLTFGGAGGAVSNSGTIRIGGSGFAALLGADVENTGTVAVPLGRIALGAGTEATLDLTGDSFLQIALPATDARIEAGGQLSAARIELRAATLAQAVRNTVNVPGSLSATGVHAEGGVIVIDGRAGATLVTGRIEAMSVAGEGGSITLGGSEIALEGAVLAASGASGGTIAVGGGAQGAALAGLTTASSVAIDGSSSLIASGSAGPGGTITVWGQDALSFAGSLTATGTGGDGGSAEISGHGDYLYAGTTNLLSDSKRTGTLLLDPYNLTISSSASSNVSSFKATGNNAVVNATTLQNSLATASITVTTGNGGAQTGTITVNSPLTWNAATTLTLGAAGGITVNAGNNITATGGGSLVLAVALGTVQVLSSTLSTGSGSITVVSNTGGSNEGIRLANATIDAGTGSAVLTGGSTSNSGIAVAANTTLATRGSVTMSGTSSSGAGVYLDSSAGITAASGDLAITGTSTSGMGVYFVAGTQNLRNNGVGAFTISGTSSGSATGNHGTGIYSSLTTSGNLSISGTNTTGYGVYLNGTTIKANSGNLALSGTSTSSNGVWIGGGTEQFVNAGAGSLAVTGSSTSAHGIRLNTSANLSLSGAVALSGSSSTSGGLSFKGSNTLTIASGAPTITAQSVSGAALLIGGGLTIANQSGTAVTLNGASTGSGNGAELAASATLGTSGDITINGVSASGQGIKLDGNNAVTASSGALLLDGSSATGNGLALTGTIALTNGGSGLTLRGSSGLAAAHAILASPAAITTSGSVVFARRASSAAGTSIVIGGSIHAASGNLTFAGPVTLASDASVDAANGSITVSGAIDGAYNLTASARNLSFAAALGASTPLASVDLASTQDLALPAITAQRILARATQAGARIVLNPGTVLTASAATQPLILSADVFENEAGATALSTPNGRWLVFSSDPAIDTFGGADSGNTALWNTSYAASGGSIAQNGNRYVFAFQPTLTFASTDLAKTYGAQADVAGAFAVAGYRPGVAGAFLGDSAARAWTGAPVLSSAGAATTAQVAGGPYAISLAPGTVAPLNGYALAFTSPGLLTLAPAPLTIRGSVTATTYTGAVQTNTYSVTGLLGTDSVISISGMASATNAGTYADALNSATGQGLGNYAITYANGSLGIAKAPLTITYGADSAHSIYGASLGGLSGKVSAVGFVPGEGLGDLGGTLLWLTSAHLGSGAGTYAIAGSGLTSSNYAITAVQASGNAAAYTITPAPLTITALGLTKDYDGHAFTSGSLAFTGLVNGDGPGSLAGIPIWGGSALGAVIPGRYAIAAGGLSSPNYLIAWQPGTLTIRRPRFIAPPAAVLAALTGQGPAGPCDVREFSNAANPAPCAAAP